MQTRAVADPRDKAMIDMLKSVGIEKGKPFHPDTTTKVMLEASAREARALIDMQYEKTFLSAIQ